LSDAVEKLKHSELFRSLNDDQLQQVANLVKWRDFKKGSEMVHYLGEDDDVYFLVSGRVTTTIFSFEGKEISYQELGPGATFGELSAIDGLPRTANVIALENSQVGVMSSAHFWQVVEQYPGVAAAALARLAGMVRFLIDRVYQYGALDVNSRVRMEVLRLARQNMSDADSAVIDNFPTHKEIASRVNTHREAVTRELNELTRLNVIEQEKRVLTVLSVSKLEDLLPESV